MPIVNRKALLPYTAEQMYAVVNNAEAYPQFLKWCERVRVLEKTETTQRAELTLSKGPVRQTFTTRNQMVPGREIRIALDEGPFRFLTGVWSFRPIAGDGEVVGCEVEMHLEFEFKAGLINRAFAQVFNPISGTLVSAFCERAHVLYGP